MDDVQSLSTVQTDSFLFPLSLESALLDYLEYSLLYLYLYVFLYVFLFLFIYLFRFL